MGSPFRFVIGAVAFLELATVALGATWSVRFDGSTVYGTTIERVPSGGMVTSTPYPPAPGTLVVALDDYGDVSWHTLLSRPAGTYGSSAVVRLSADGGYFVATTLGIAGEPQNALLAKLDAAGSIVWQRAWSGGAGFAVGSDVVALADGGCLLLGGLFIDGTEQLWVMRADASGATVWSETIDSSGISGGRARALANGDIVLTATSTGTGAGTSGLVARLTPDGSIVWQRSLNGPTAVYLTALATTTSGDILVGGSVGNRGQGSGQAGALLVRLSGQGALLGTRLYRGPLRINGITATVDGRIALGGDVFGLADKFQQLEDGFVIVADATGFPITASTHGGPGQDGINAIVESGDGGFLVAGTGSPSTTLGPYMVVEKLDASGAVGSACARIASRVIDLDTRPITVRPSSAVVTPFTPAASPLVFTNGIDKLGAANLVCSAP